jgi:hypothetical protein
MREVAKKALEKDAECIYTFRVSALILLQPHGINELKDARTDEIILGPCVTYCIRIHSRRRIAYLYMVDI